jgi:predicted nucleotidyltransferase
MKELDKIIEKLRSNDDVDAVFLTGSNATQESKSYSDIDLVVILKENKNSLYSLYKWIDNIFAEIFFFDLSDIQRIVLSKNIDSDNFDAILLDWIKKSNIYFDKSGVTTNLKSKASEIDTSHVSEKSKRGYWQRINHNYIADKRYFDSGDKVYHEALEMKLFYSMEQVTCGYFALRDIPWRGEKNAILYMKENAKDFYKLFQDYAWATSLSERFKAYSQMVDFVFTDKCKKWTNNVEIILKKDFSVADEEDSVSSYVKSLFYNSNI